jgi:Putative prokaryotic signal transducing protein
MSAYLTTGSNELEADIILSRLAEAGINAWQQGTLGGRPGYAGARDVYVQDADLEPARKALKAAQDVDEDELVALSEGEAEQTRDPGQG